MTDNDDVLRQARDAVPEIHMGTPVETIMARGAARRHRRLVQAAVAGTAVAAAAAAAVFAGVAGAGAAAPHAKDTIRTVGFTLVKNTNGTLTLSMGQMFDPAALQQALAQDGIPAMVKSGEYCTSDRAPAHGQVVSVQLPNGQPVQPNTAVPSDAVNVINPAELPTGTEAVFSFFNGTHDLMFSVVDPDSYSCSPTPPAGSSPPSGASGSSGNS